MTKKIFGIVVLTVVLIGIPILMKGAPANNIKLDKEVYTAGETINVYFTASPDLSDSAWIGIVPSHVEHGSEVENDRNDLGFQYLDYQTSGSLTFTAPTELGTYDFRMNSSDDSGVELAYVTFEVKEIEAPSENTVKLPRKVYKVGESISVLFTASADLVDSAWIGIVPSHVEHGSEVENDRHDLGFKYLEKKTSGMLTFKAPMKAGTYDFRMNSSDDAGVELAHVTFEVREKLGTLSLAKEIFKPGETISVQFRTGEGFEEFAWIGIVPSHVKHGSELLNDRHDVAHQFLKNRRSGTLKFDAPLKKGQYDFRLNDSDDGGKEAAYVTFTVE